MLEFLRTYYGMQAQKSKPIRGIPSYEVNSVHYVVFRASEHGEFMMEQAVIAYYLHEQGQPHIAFPIHNIDGQFITTIDDQAYTVLQVNQKQEQSTQRGGKELAYFHNRATSYPYEPHTLSSYGKWKQLWIDKLTVYEQYLQASLQEERNEMERMWLDLFPYVIGITENAIQYIGEMEYERSFNESDRPTITFDRYADQLLQQSFFSYELQYDHPMRDVAEWVRRRLLEENDAHTDIIQFLEDYERVQPLSLFSWKMIYARLLFPAHFFDAFDAHRNKDATFIQSSVTRLSERQHVYEMRLTSLFSQIERNDQTIRIPMVQWM